MSDSPAIKLFNYSLGNHLVTEKEIKAAIEDTNGLYVILLQFTNLLYAIMQELHRLKQDDPSKKVSPIYFVYYDVFIALCKALEEGQAKDLEMFLTEIDSANGNTTPRFPVSKTSGESRLN